MPTSRRGRPKKEWSRIDKEKMQLTDDIIRQLKFNANLSDEQMAVLQSTLDDTLKSYDLEKQSNPAERSVADINNLAVQDFIATKRSEGKSKNTIYNYGNELSKMLMVIGKDYREITTQDIRDYIQHRRDHDGVSNMTCQNIRMYLMSFFKWAKIDERIITNPMDKIGTIKRETKVVNTFTDEDIEIIRCACQNERDLAIVDLLSSSGMRVSELTGLNKTDVNFETGEIKVFGKGSKERICFMSGRCKVHLKWYLDSRVDDNTALFVTSKRPYNRITKNGVEYILKEIGRKTGLNIKGSINPHKFRHTLATNMINKGVDAGIVQGILGHSDVSTTLSVYAAISNETLHNAHTKYVS